MATVSDITTLRRKIILLIMEDVDLCTLLRNYYRRKNYEVFITHDGDDAIQFLNQQTPDYILADPEIPNLYIVRKHAAAVAPDAPFFLAGIDKREIKKL